MHTRMLFEKTGIKKVNFYNCVQFRGNTEDSHVRRRLILQHESEEILPTEAFIHGFKNKKSLNKKIQWIGLFQQTLKELWYEAVRIFTPVCKLFLKWILVGRVMEGVNYDKAFKMAVGEN